MERPQVRVGVVKSRQGGCYTHQGFKDIVGELIFFVGAGFTDIT
jgi:hypothetical protein